MIVRGFGNAHNMLIFAEPSHRDVLDHVFGAPHSMIETEAYEFRSTPSLPGTR